MLYDPYQKLTYGFVFTVDFFEKTYVARTDRALYDWIIEPLPEEPANSDNIEVSLPEGYFRIGTKIYDPTYREWAQGRDVEHTVRIGRVNYVGIKARLVMMISARIEKAEFDAYRIPPERIFRLNNGYTSNGYAKERP